MTQKKHYLQSAKLFCDKLQILADSNHEIVYQPASQPCAQISWLVQHVHFMLTVDLMCLNYVHAALKLTAVLHILTNGKDSVFS